MQRVASRVPVPPSATGDTSDALGDELTHLELQKLQRQYRIMEGDRKAYSDESRLLIAKQRASIDKLRRDNEYLRSQLRLIELRAEDRKKNGTLSKKAEEMLEHAETFQRKCRQIAIEVANLDNQTLSLTRTIDSHRTMLGGVNAAAQNSEATAKQLRILENRLDKALVKFNNALSVNRRMRSVIDNLRRERTVFDGIYRRLERELLDQKRLMADVVESSNAAYEQRDEAQTRIIVLRDKTEKEHQAYLQEIKDLDRAVIQDRRLKDFMSAKFSVRSTSASSSRGGGGKRSSGNPTAAATTTITRPQSLEAITETILSQHEAALAEIQRVTGIKDISRDLVTHFRTIEDQNFSLFNYVTEINNEIEAMREDVRRREADVAELRDRLADRDDARRKQIAALEIELTSVNDQISSLNARHASATSMLTDIRTTSHRALQTLVNSFTATTTSPTATETTTTKNTEFATTAAQILATASTTTLQDSTLMPTLALIENRAIDLLLAHIALSAKDKGRSHRTDETSTDAAAANIIIDPATNGGNGTGGLGLLGAGPEAVIDRLEIAPPTGDDDDDEEIEEQRPLTEEEIRARALLKGLSTTQRNHMPLVLNKSSKRRKRRG